MRNIDPARAKWMRIRMGVLSGILGLGAGAVVASAYRVQVEDGDAWRAAAEKQRERKQEVKPKRGSVFDRHGSRLATSIEVPSASIDVEELLGEAGKSEGQKAESAKKGNEDLVLRAATARLSQILSIDPVELYRKLATKKRFLWLKRKISLEEAQALRDIGDPKKEPQPIRGIVIEAEMRRFYPAREVAGSLLGFVSPDGDGKDGLELALDEDLRGKAEEIEGLRDRSGRWFALPGAKTSVAGHDVELTIDQAIQHLAESELSSAQRTYETIGGSVVVMDPSTGEILALASTPGFNPNDYSTSDVEARRDRAITDRFEPGSVMKVFTIAGALERGKLSTEEKVYCEHGTYKLGPVTIHDTHQNDWLTPEEILKHSSNIGALKIGLALGEADLYSTYRKFGFGEPTNIPLPGEASGVLRPRGRPWVDVETANASFGQGISATSLQLATAMSAIAGDGKLIEPVLVRRVTDVEGNIVRDAELPRVRREAVSPRVAKTVREMLVSVTEKGGTGEEAAVHGFRVGGKTATAQKVDPGTGKYSTDKFTASFVGFIPAEKPRLVIAVVLDEPMIGHYGGDLAGPVFRRVAGEAMRYLGQTPPDQGHIALRASPKNEPLRASASLASMVSLKEPEPGTVRVPDLNGLPMREALKVLSKSGLVPTLAGSGRLVKQSLPAGTTVPKGSTLELLFEPTT